MRQPQGCLRPTAGSRHSARQSPIANATDGGTVELAKGITIVGNRYKNTSWLVNTSTLVLSLTKEYQIWSFWTEWSNLKPRFWHVCVAARLQVRRNLTWILSNCDTSIETGSSRSSIYVIYFTSQSFCSLHKSYLSELESPFTANWNLGTGISEYRPLDFVEKSDYLQPYLGLGRQLEALVGELSNDIGTAACAHHSSWDVLMDQTNYCLNKEFRI